jgi:preprotein translocase subunit SecF
VEKVMNKSVNQILSRTIITSLTTLLVLVCLFLLGGAVIQNFALALIIGVLVGTYSSIYVAAALALVLGVDRTVMLPVKKEGEELDDRP